MDGGLGISHASKGSRKLLSSLRKPTY
jgi:hypothetical protein